MYERPNGSAKLTFVREPMAGTVVTETPLYTYPAKTLTDDPLVNFKPVWQEKPELTLTDEEIAEVFDNTFKVRDFDDAFLKFARAILRKVQEK
jgi:hypothetical protein